MSAQKTVLSVQVVDGYVEVVITPDNADEQVVLGLDGRAARALGEHIFRLGCRADAPAEA